MADKRLLSREWRLSNLYKIRDKDGKISRFRKNRAQRHFDATKHTRNLILKSRQLGFTTFEALDCLDEALFRRDINVDTDVIAHRDADVVQIFQKKIEFPWNHIPQEIRNMYFLKKDSSRALAFGLYGKESESFNSISVTNSSRSGTKSRVHVTELAFLDAKRPLDSQEIISGCAPALGTDGRWDIESTARGRKGLFYEMCIDAHERKIKGLTNSKKDFKLHFYNWTWDDYELSKISEKDTEILKTEWKLLPYFCEVQLRFGYSDTMMACYYGYFLSLFRNYELLKQEFPNTVEEAFEASADILFDAMAITKMEKTKPRESGKWKFYEEYNRNHVYGVGSDVAEGIGKDSSSACVWNFSTPKPKVVATFADNKTDPIALAYELAMIGKMYGNCILAPERNNHGHTTIAKLKEIYDNSKIFQMHDRTREQEKESTKYGWETNLSTKPLMMHELANAVATECVDIPDEGIQKEMMAYDTEDLKKMKKEEGMTRHFDSLIACAIGYQIRNKRQIPEAQHSSDIIFAK